MPKILGLVRYPLRKIIGFMAWRLPHGAHITRYSMYRELDGKFLDETKGEGKRVLCVSGSRPLAELMGLGNAEIVSADYPEHSILDLNKIADRTFDFIISDQVLEHIEGNPQKAFDESLRVLKQGGIAVHTTCFVNPIHLYPVDLWRFTPHALRYLASGFSEVIAADGWGNRGVWIVEWLGLRFTPVPHATWHPLHKIATRNDKLWPVSTWIIARK